MAQTGPVHAGDALIRTALLRWDSACLIQDGTPQYQRTGRQLFEEVLALSQVLREEFQPGHLRNPSAILYPALLRNGPDYIIFWLSVCVAGGVFVPLNWRWTGRECLDALETVGAPFLIHDHASAPLALAAAAASSSTRIPLIPLTTLLAKAALLRGKHATTLLYGLPSPPPESTLRALLDLRWAHLGVALVCFTSGTTGKAKAAAISHEAIVFQSLQKLRYVHYSSTDVYLHTAPLFHIGGASSCHANLFAGAVHVFPDPAAPATPATTLDIMQRHAVTSMISVPAMIVDLLRAAESRGIAEIPSLRRILVGAGTMTPHTLAQTLRLWPNAAIHTAYGMSEAASSITFHRLARNYDEEAAASALPVPRGAFLVGVPPDQIQVRIQRIDDAAPEGEGEVQLRGPNLMSGYLVNGGDASDNVPSAWRLEALGAWTADGWLKTGDIGFFRGPVLFLRGRAKDMIKSGGENVFAGEVEGAISSLPGCLECAAVGTPDARLGETVTAVVVGKPGGERVGLEALVRHCRDQGLAGFKLPRRLIWLPEALPRNSMGKVDKKALMARLEELEGSGPESRSSAARARL